MHKLSVIVALALAGLSTGCGAQLTTGWQARGHEPDAAGAPQVMGLGARFLRPRDDGLYLGADVVATTPAYEGDVALRQVLLSSGYRVRLHPVALELGVEFGAGEPALESIGGTGFYLGAAPALLVRLSGEHDATTGYAVAGVLVDLLAIGRIGVWGRPADDDGPELLDGGGQIGVRFTFISDIARSSDRDWEPP